MCWHFTKAHFKNSGETMKTLYQLYNHQDSLEGIVFSFLHRCLEVRFMLKMILSVCIFLQVKVWGGGRQIFVWTWFSAATRLQKARNKPQTFCIDSLKNFCSLQGTCKDSMHLGAKKDSGIYNTGGGRVSFKVCQRMCEVAHHITALSPTVCGKQYYSLHRRSFDLVQTIWHDSHWNSNVLFAVYFQF